MESSFNDITVVIPVREGSTRIEKKVSLPFHEGYNLLEWKINQVKKIQSPDRIVVSSNSQNIRNIASNMGVKYHERGEYLTEGHRATFSEVITGIVEDIETEHFAWITVVVPLMSPEEYKKGFERYLTKVINDKKHDSLFAANLLKEYLWDENEPINYKADKNHTISQNLPNIYQVTNGLYMRDKQSTLNEGYFLGENPYKYKVSKMAGIDIDVWEDYEFAKAMIPFYEDKI